MFSPANKYIIDWPFLVQVHTVPIHNNGDPKRFKGISKAIGEHAHAHSQLPQSRWLRACEQRNEGYTKDHRSSKRKAYEGPPAQ